MNDSNTAKGESRENIAQDPNPSRDDTFMENVNEVLEMLDRESIDQDQVQQYQASERYEAVDTTSRESNDQLFFSEPEQKSNYVIEPELYWMKR